MPNPVVFRQITSGCAFCSATPRPADPTTRLDRSPRVAVHFATFEEEHYDKDGAIWCVDVVGARELVPRRLRQLLRRHYAITYSVDMLEFIDSLDSSDRMRK
jgi:hypothetical protein